MSTESINVLALFVADRYRTRVWISDRAAEALGEYSSRTQPRGAFLRKLERYAENGFEHYCRGDGSPIKHEWEQVFRIGDGGLFRLIGFFDGDRDFVIIDAFLKKKQKLGGAERDRIDEVRRIREAKRWRRKGT